MSTSTIDSGDLGPIADALFAQSERCEDGQLSSTHMATRQGVPGELVFEANRCGMVRLAAKLVELAAKEPGAHLHFDDASELADSLMPVVFALVADSDPRLSE